MNTQQACRAALVSLALLVTVFTNTVMASATTVGRYLTVDNGPRVTQAFPLAQTFHITFPSSIHSVGGAMGFLLMNTGYTLATLRAQDGTIKALLTKPLPQGDRTLGEMTVATGLLTLAGNVYQLVIDPAHRLVGFRLRVAFSAVYQHPTKQEEWKW